METKLVVINKELGELEFQQLMEYEKKIEHISNMNKMMASTYLRDFIVAADIASTNLARAIQLNIRSKTVLDTTKAIAYLDKAGPFLASKGIKESSAAREQYVDCDADVCVRCLCECGCCEKTFCAGCLMRCAQCRTSVCNGCHTRCNNCGRVTCDDCKETCYCCDGSFCGECFSYDDENCVCTECQKQNEEEESEDAEQARDVLTT